jgi:hypothetical protein
MRPPVDEARIRELARRLGGVATDRVRIYLTGGATAVVDDVLRYALLMSTSVAGSLRIAPP